MKVLPFPGEVCMCVRGEGSVHSHNFDISVMCGRICGPCLKCEEYEAKGKGAMH